MKTEKRQEQGITRREDQESRPERRHAAQRDKGTKERGPQETKGRGKPELNQQESDSWEGQRKHPQGPRSTQPGEGGANLEWKAC